jgi:enamine deaminase RidA (YjgF/YER057c/UK114 family)
MEHGMTIENRVAEMKLELPPPFRPGYLFRPVHIIHGYAYTAGHGPMLSSGKFLAGKVGVDFDIDQARAAARQTGLSILASIRANLGSLDRLARVVKTLGMVNCTPDFGAHPMVIDGCSQLFIEILGDDRGMGVRSAVGMSSLPFQMPVEIEMVFELKP